MAQSTADTADAHMAVSGPAVPAPTLVDIYLLCYVPSPLFHAHWSVFVPNVGQLSPERGTVINVRGDPFKGFAHEFERGYVPSQDPEKPPLITKLASIDGSLVARCPGQRDGPVEVGTDVAPQNELERLALQVGAPGPSLGRRASQDVCRLNSPAQSDMQL